MTKPLIIFGAGELAELAYFYFGKLAERNIVSFCLDAEYIKNDSAMGLPIIPFQEVLRRFPPEQYEMFIAIGSSHVNKVRRDKYITAKKLGYTLATCISPHAVVHTDQVGENCLIMDCNNIHPYTKVGNNIIFSNSNHVGHHTILEDHLFITSNVVIGGGSRIGEGSFLGINATIRDHITIGQYNVIGAGTLIMQDTKDEAVFSIPKTEARKITSNDIKNL
jgi:sugar O-acyltransferase (sialic acid O-acetyltransferase NeuD family)